MKNIKSGEPVALLMEIKSLETPFIGRVGNVYKALDVVIDPHMPSGYAVVLANGGGTEIHIDKSAVVHYDDWKNIHNAVIKQALSGALLGALL